MTLIEAILLFIAALVAGALNSVAGGGSFFTFPALLFTGVPAIAANATSTLAVWPGSLASATAYRKKLPHNLGALLPLLIASLAGGITGAGLLLHTSDRFFLRLIPFLFLAATLFFALGPKILKYPKPLQKGSAELPWLLIGTVTLLQFVTGVYGGYFGGGMGILMLAFLTLLPLGDIHAMNSVKTVLGAAINGVAVAAFILARIIEWPQGILMLIGAILGGYGGAHYAQRINPAKVRGFVVVVGLTMSFVFLWKFR